MDKKTAVKAIREAGVVTSAIRYSYFPGEGFGAIRSWLEENGFDRHLAIELRSTDCCFRSADGMLHLL